jgi:hypothetical protein
VTVYFELMETKDVSYRLRRVPHAVVGYIEKTPDLVSLEHMTFDDPTEVERRLGSADLG